MNRRTVLKATAATLAGATSITGAQALSTLKAATAPSLADLVASWRQAYKTASAAQDEADGASIDARKEYPEPPRLARIRTQLVSGEVKVYVATAANIERYCQAQLNVFGDTGPNADKIRAFRDRRLKAFKQWQAECEVVDEAHDVPALEDRANKLWWRADDLQKAIIEAPVQSIQDLQAKADFWGDFLDLDVFDTATTDERIAMSIYHDIKRMVS